MLGTTFSHGVVRDCVVAFGTLFNNIKINRPRAAGEDSNTIAVPLAYAPKQRYIERLTQDPNLDRPVSMSFPRMSFEMTSMTYSAERKLNTMQRYHGRRSTANSVQVSSAYSPVPYDISFQLNIYISNIEDGTHIIEQILPYFTPEFTLSLGGHTDLNLNVDLPIVLNAVTMEDNYEGDFASKRFINWTLDFTMKTNLFGPVSNGGGIIKTIFLNLHPTMNTAVANNFEQVRITPGLFANGDPTTNSTLSIDSGLISSNSDYGISIDIYDFHSGGVETTIGIWPSQFYGLGTAASGTMTQHRWAYFTKAINDDWGTGNSLRFRVHDDDGWWSDVGDGHSGQVGSANFSTGTGLEQLGTSEWDTNDVVAAYDADATWPSWLIGFYGHRDISSSGGYGHESWVYVTDPSQVPDTTSFTVLSTTYVEGGVTKYPMFTLKSGGWTQVSGSDSAVYKRQLQHIVPAGTVTYNDPNSSGTASYTVVADNASGRPMLILDSQNSTDGYQSSVYGPGGTQTATANNRAYDNSTNGDGSGSSINDQSIGFKDVAALQIIRIYT